MGEVYAVILVGGKGKRLKPLSTNSKPKAFLSVTKNKKTMFRNTVDRISNIIPSENIFVVANKAHARLVKRDFPNISKENLLLEPISRNTAPAIALAAKTLRDRFEDVVMVVIPTDQYVMDEHKYLDSIKKGIKFVSKNRAALIALGVKPAFPSTELGYIRVQGKGLMGQGIYKAERFVEKPDLKTAKKYLKSKRYLWNAGAFIFSTHAILKAFKIFARDIFNGLKEPDNITKRYKTLPDISIDYAVMEKADNIYCVKGSYRWQDMGSFESLKTILKREKRKFVLKNGKIVKIL